MFPSVRIDLVWLVDLEGKIGVAVQYDLRKGCMKHGPLLKSVSIIDVILF